MKEVNAFGENDDDDKRNCLYCTDDYIVNTCGSKLSIYERKGFTRKGKFSLKWKNQEDFPKKVLSICLGRTFNSIALCGE